MSHGIEIYNANGTLTYSTADVTWNQVDFFFVAGNGSASNTYSVLTDREVMVLQIMVDPPPSDRRAIAHTITVSGTNVSVSGGSEAAFVLVLMR